MIKQDLRKEYILTEQECEKKGGHKYEQYLTFFSAELGRVCKYCGHEQRGYNPPTVWEDDKS